jgi:acetyl-CoA carboxylase biotin carboxylase subunit
VAKFICWGDSRAFALQRMRRALNEYVIEGIKTNLPFLRRVIDDERFRAGKYDTRLVDQILSDKLNAASTPSESDRPSDIGRSPPIAAASKSAKLEPAT